VLLRPVFAGHTIVLWIATPILLGGGLVALAVWAMRRRRPDTGAAKLTSEEEGALERLRKG